MNANIPISRKPLRLWPGVAAVAVQWVLWFVLPAVAPQASMYGMLGAIAMGAVVLAWWLFFSRAPWLERVGAVVLMVIAVVATFPLVHPSIANGAMGLMLPFYSIPALSLALVAWAVVAERLSGAARPAALVASVLLACAAFTLIRTDGIRGEGGSDLHWRWTPTPEERLLARAADALLPAPQPGTGAPPTAPASAPPEAPSPSATAPEPPSEPAAADPPEPSTPGSGDAPAMRSGTIPEGPAAAGADPAPARAVPAWPGFRGPERDGVVRGVRIATDWSQTPPVEVWRRPIGPGWSSFAVTGDFIYTQEQRGDDEIVSCYRLSTGEPVWGHRDAARFWESNGGPGPRATPTLHGGRVYSFGATGILNALDARSGARFWSRDVAADTGVKVPDWGFASSPLVIGDRVIIAAAGHLAAYDAATGSLRWSGPSGGAGYSSPHLLTIDGVPQVLLLRGSRTISVAPADGRLLWEHVGQPGAGIVQPAAGPDGDVLLALGDGMGGGGMHRVEVARGPAGWTVAERWNSRGLKPYFNDFVVHEGHAYGFDGSILASIDLSDGARKWKGGRYGHGQLVLLPDQDLLLVLSEEGELALVSATPDKHTEVAKFKALEGKTWNHPAIAGDLILVRNGEEMAAFRLPRAER